MASIPVNKGSVPKSRFNSTVCLADWWLVKTEQGTRLAVSGYTCRGQAISSTSCGNKYQAIRVFSSAPILKRYDDFTIETTDGICVIFKGLINKARTVENGFSSDVFNHFVFGFPLYWKEYEENCMGKESSSNDISGSDPLKILRPLPEFESEQLHAENCENDLESLSKPTDKAGFDKDMGSSRDIPSRSEGRVRTRSMNSLKTKQNNDEKSAKVSDCEPESKNNCNSQVTDKLKLSGFEAGVLGESVSVRVSRTPNRDSDLRKVKTEGYVKKGKSKLNSPSGMKTGRSLEYETPDLEKDEACASFNRSRPGRLLKPSLEFWHNQKPICDVGERIIGTEEGSFPEQSKGSSSPVKRKRRQPR